MTGLKGAVRTGGLEGDSLEAALGLGDLAELTVHNEAEAAGYEVDLNSSSAVVRLTASNYYLMCQL